MSFNVIATEPFERKLRKLAKKHRSIKDDLFSLISSLEQDPIQGIPLGKECYKIRLAIRSKGKGKSGGAYVRISKKNVFLMDIYDKSEQDSISDKELEWLINLLAEYSLNSKIKTNYTSRALGACGEARRVYHNTGFILK